MKSWKIKIKKFKTKANLILQKIENIQHKKNKKMKIINSILVIVI